VFILILFTFCFVSKVLVSVSHS